MSKHRAGLPEPASYRKAIAGWIAGTGTALAPVAGDGLTLKEIGTALVLGLLAGLVVYFGPANEPASGTLSDEDETGIPGV